MNDPRRLAEDDPHFADFVTAARQLRPRAEVLHGLLQKLPSRAPGGVSASERAPSRLRRWGMLAGAGGCVLVAVATFDLSQENASSTPPTRSDAPATVETGGDTPGRSSPDDTRQDPTGADIGGEAVPSVHVDELPIARSSAPTSRRETPGGSAAQPKSLGHEIVLIAAARDALTRGDPAGCIAAVRAHEAEFPNGQFKLEARAMYVEAVAARGDRERARELVREFLVNNPRSPYDERMRSLLASLESQ